MPKSNDPVVSVAKYATFAQVHEIQIRLLDLDGGGGQLWLLVLYVPGAHGSWCGFEIKNCIREK
jgi:hypothetical protein